MDDRDLLPPDLKEQSLSDREIVFTLEHAFRAIAYLEQVYFGTGEKCPGLSQKSHGGSEGKHFNDSYKAFISCEGDPKDIPASIIS